MQQNVKKEDIMTYYSQPQIQGEFKYGTTIYDQSHWDRSSKQHQQEEAHYPSGASCKVCRSSFYINAKGLIQVNGESFSNCPDCK